MDQPNGHPCPECGAPRHADNTPSCACARRAADALRDARTAEAAAAEDFDPLRIRPYVDLNGTTPDGLPEATRHAPPSSGTPQAPAQEGASADEPAEGPRTASATPAGPGAHPGAAGPSAHGGPTAPGRPAGHGTPPAAGPAADGRTSAPEDRRTTATRAGNEAPGAPDATMTLTAVSPGAATSGEAARGPAAAAPEAGGAAGIGEAPHTGSPAHAAPGAENRASVPGGPQVPANTTGAAAHDSAMASDGPADIGAAPRGGAPHAGTAHTGSPADAAPGAGASAGPRAQAGDAAPDATMTLRAVRPDAAAPGTAKPGTAAAGTPAPDDRTSVLPTPLAPGTARPNADDLGLFDDATRPLRAVSAGAAAPRPEGAAPRNRRRRGALIAASGAVVALLGAAGWASGLLSYDTPSRDTAAPDDVRASVPDASSAVPSEEPSSEAPSASPSASASASDSPSASASGSPSPSASSSAPSASATAEPSATPSAAESSAPAAAPEPEEPVDTAPVLRRGDGGPEVVELQQRLRQVWLYQGDLNGRYTHRVEDAVRHYQWSRGIDEELGVYGPQTRSRLESETSAP